MKKKLIIMSLLVFLLTGLSTSSFFLSEYLTNTIAKNEHSEAQLSFALAQENLAALNFALKQTPFHSEQWLKFTKLLAKTQGKAAYQLAVYYQNKPKQAIFWYKSASRLGYHQASTALAQHYFEQNKLIQAAEILATLPIDTLEEVKIEVIVLKVNVAINQGRIADVKAIINKYVQPLKTTEIGRRLLDDIEKYQVQFTASHVIKSNEVTKSNQLSVSCNNSIQLFATNLKHLKQVENLIVDFKEQVLSHFVCFSPVRYMPIKALDCSNDQNTAIRCDELNWQLWAGTINTRYVGIMLPKGGANVHLGMLYFDAQDSVDVVAHEISHLLGFVDEYPLVAEHVKCQAPQKTLFSQNIAVLKNSYQGNQKDIRAKVLKQLPWSKYIKNNTPILQSVTDLVGKHYWQLGTPEEYKNETGLFKAQTCNNSNAQLIDDFSAFKGVSHRTKLQYFALKFPQLYTALLQENSTQYRMPSFHYNIALAYFQQTSIQRISLQQTSFQKKSIDQANYWLEQAASWEHDLDRHKKIRQGGF